MIKPLVKSVWQTLAGTVGWYKVKRGDKKLIVLMYHRVLPTTDPRYQFEEPGMVVSDTTFAMHMQVLSEENINVMTVSQWSALPADQRPQLTVAITFDDGWLDNYEYAFPVLKRYNFASTLYVVSDFMDMPAPFWPNKVLRLLLTPGLQQTEAWQPLLALTGTLPPLPLTRDQGAAVIDHLKQHGDDTIYAALAPLSDVLASHTQTEMINQQQLHDALTNYGVELGCHTRRHYRLVEGLSETLLQEEIVQSKQLLEAANNRRVASFCFPNGDFSPAAHKLVSEHYDCAVTTKRGINTAANLQTSKLLRIGVHNDISNTPMKFRAKLSGAR